MFREARGFITRQGGRAFRSTLILLLIAGIHGGIQVDARVPVPDLLLYGKVIDANGEIISSSNSVAALTVRIEVNSLQVLYPLGTIPEAGDSYVIRVPRDDGVAPRLAGTTAGGDEFHLFINNVEVQETKTNTLSVATDIIDVRELDLHVGLELLDQDGDGLADAWEERHFTNTAARAGPLDFDGDGLTDTEEHQAGTDPTNPDSLLAIDNEQDDPAGFTFEWPSATNRLYTIQRAARLKEDFQSIATDVPATPPINSFTDPDATGTNRIYYLIFTQSFP